MSGALPARRFWHGKRVLVTGHTGFKGAWLALWLNKLGAHVTGIALPPDSEPNLFNLAQVQNLCESHFCDIRDSRALTRLIQEARPEIVFHLAAQALVRQSYRAPIETFAANVMGTAHVLDALRGVASVAAAVMVTTDKVYSNNEWHWPYREGDVLGGHDPYSASKAACEIVIESFRKSFLAEQGVALASARAGNVIGGGDWSRDRLIPDAVRAWHGGEVLEIRRPDARRPWQHVLEPLAGYLLLAQQLVAEPALAGAYNFGPSSGQSASVRQVVEMARAIYAQGEVAYADVVSGPHEAGWLSLEIAKARQMLGFEPRMTLARSVECSLAWYRAQMNGSDARALCEADITAYERSAPLPE